MKAIVLGAPQRTGSDNWKLDVADGCAALGWDVSHLPAHGIAADDVVTACRGADLLIWARTHGHTPHGDAHEMLRRVEATGTLTAGLHFDLYWGIPRREVRIGKQPWWTCQWVFTADGGDRDWASRGVNHRWAPPAFGERFLGRAATGPARDAVFVGTNSRSVHSNHRSHLLHWAHARWGPGFAHLGRYGEKVWGHELNAVYAGARVVLGDSAPADRYWSDRIPRTLGRGGLLAYPNTPGLAEQGFTGEHMVLYDRFAFDDLGERLDNLTDAQRRETTDAALALIEGRHLMRHRMAEIARTVGLT